MQNIQERRKELGLTLADVAKAVGVSKGTVSRWESGQIDNMRRDRLTALAKVLQVSPLSLMGMEDDPSPEVLPDNVQPGIMRDNEEDIDSWKYRFHRNPDNRRSQKQSGPEDHCPCGRQQL